MVVVVVLVVVVRLSRRGECRLSLFIKEILRRCGRAVSNSGLAVWTQFSISHEHTDLLNQTFSVPTSYTNVMHFDSPIQIYLMHTKTRDAF